MLSHLWAVVVLKWFPESGYGREVARSIPTTGIVFPVCRMSADLEKLEDNTAVALLRFQS